MTIVIKIELSVFDQIVTSVSFDIKNENLPPRNDNTLKTIVCQTAPLAKLPPGGLLFIHKIWRFQTKCRFF